MGSLEAKIDALDAKMDQLEARFDALGVIIQQG